MPDLTRLQRYIRQHRFPLLLSALVAAIFVLGGTPVSLLIIVVPATLAWLDMPE